MGILSIIVPLLIVVTGVSLFLYQKNKKRNLGVREGEEALLQAALKKSKKNNNVSALELAADIYLKRKEYSKAFPLYQRLVGLIDSNKNVNEVGANLGMGLSAANLGYKKEAYDYLYSVKDSMATNFDVNYHIGLLEFEKGRFDVSANFMMKARKLDQEHLGTSLYLGMCLEKLGHHSQAILLLKKALTAHPENISVIYALASSYYNTGSFEQAKKLYQQVIKDESKGADSAYHCGLLEQKVKKYDAAAKYYLLAIKHKIKSKDVEINSRYELALCLLELGQIAPALSQLRAVSIINPEYKSTQQLMKRYEELDSNKNLQTYLLADNNNFVSLCRKIVQILAGSQKITIEGITEEEKAITINAVIETAKFEESVSYFFKREELDVEDKEIRDFNERVKISKVSRGVFITPSNYSHTAVNFTEGRSIELIDRKRLSKILVRIGDS